RRLTGAMLTHAEEHAVGRLAGAHEARVFDEHPPRADDLVGREPVVPCLQDGAAPSLEAVSRRPLAFDLKTGAGIGQQEKARRARNEMAACSAYGFARLAGEIERQNLLKSLGPSDDGTELAGAEE